MVSGMQNGMSGIGPLLTNLNEARTNDKSAKATLSNTVEAMTDELKQTMKHESRKAETDNNQKAGSQPNPHTGFSHKRLS